MCSLPEWFVPKVSVLEMVPVVTDMGCRHANVEDVATVCGLSHVSEYFQWSRLMRLAISESWESGYFIGAFFFAINAVLLLLLWCLGPGPLQTSMHQGSLMTSA